MITQKKSYLVDDLFKSGVGFEEMPLSTVLEYAEDDVKSCAEVYLSQQNDFEKTDNKSLSQVVILMNEMLEFLVEVETNGVKIDLDILNTIGEEFKSEYTQVFSRLEAIIEQVMGDTPINLNSGADVSKVIYSRVVNDRHTHIQTFNLGTSANGRHLYPPRMNPAEFASAVRSTTDVVYKTQVQCCDICDGRGLIRKHKKDGSPYKNLSKCVSCNGVGAHYHPTKRVAGLKLTPASPAWACVHGFKSDKSTLDLLKQQAKNKGYSLALEFLTHISRLNALATYLNSFVKGIEIWTRPTGLIHTNFNQCVTATGRLSSSNINLQNMPKRGFPVRKAMVSRFDFKIVEFDYSQLEFRIAGELSRDPQIISDVTNGKDIHKQTASIINQSSIDQISKEQRQSAKAHTFAPLYGGTGAGEQKHVRNYFSEFFVVYQGLKQYQKRLMDGVASTGIVQTPSGRQYYWPNARRLKNGRVTNATQVVNYPIQGFATGDIVPLACIRAFRLFKKHNLKSKLILTVHDSIVVDCHPDELTQVKKVLVEAMANVGEELEQRFDYKPVLPLDVEMTVGPNWLDQEEIPLD